MKIVVSSCLLGLPTRYDGRSKLIEFSSGAAELEFIPFCPEMEAGLGVPRECIELVQLVDGSIRVMGRESRRDVTDVIEACCLRMVEKLKKEAVACFILKARSPSCGMISALHDMSGREIGQAPGVWARIVAESFPGVPCVSEEDAYEPLLAVLAQKKL